MPRAIEHPWDLGCISMQRVFQPRSGVRS